MATQQDAITAAVGIFSGRPNPEVQLTGDSAQALARLVKSDIGKEPTSPPATPRLGFYYGFAVRMAAELARSLGLPPQFSVYQGVLTEPIERGQRHWRDVAGVEEFLLDQAHQQGHTDLLRMVGVERQQPGR
jgi:hypothetical protein